MSKTYLKVKIKSLAAEARIIRKEEHKAKAHYRYLKNKQGHEDQMFDRKPEPHYWHMRLFATSHSYSQNLIQIVLPMMDHSSMN